MNRQQRAVREFHEKHGRTIRDKPEMADGGNLLIQVGELRTNAGALYEKINQWDMVAIAEGLSHVIYQAYSMATVLGIDLGTIFDVVHRLNMTREVDDKKAIPMTEEIIKSLHAQGWRPKL